MSKLEIEIGAVTDGLSKGLKDAESKLQRFSQTAVSVGKTLSLAVTAPIVGFGTLAARTFGNFEASLNRVQAVTNATGVEFEQLSAKARELGSTTQFSASQAADGINFLAIAGFDTTKILESLDDTLKLAAASGLDLGRSADIISNVLTGFRLETDELSGAVDVLSKSFTSSNTDLNQLADALKFAAPVASSFGVSIEETVAAIGKLSDAGLQGSIAGTGLRRVFAALAKDADKLGIVTTNAAGKLRPLADIIEDLEKRGITASEALEIFGDRGGPALLTLLETGSQALRSYTSDLENSGGTADRLSSIQLRGLNGALRELRSVFEELQIRIGESGLANALGKLIAKLTDTIRFVAQLDDRILGTITVLAAITAAIGPLLVVLGSLGAALPIIASGFAAVKVAVIAATGPFGLIAAAIGAAIFLLIDLNRELKRTAEIAGEVRASNLDETTKNIKNEVDELAKSYQRINTDLTENEAKQKALNTVLEAYETRLKSIQETDPGNLNRISFLREQIGAIKNLQNEFNGLTVEVTNTGSAVKQTLEQFSKLADIANEKVFAKFAEDARIFNDELRETIDLQRRLEQAASGISFGGDIQDFGDLSGGAPPVIETPEIDDSPITRYLLRLQEFREQATEALNFGVGNVIGDFAFSIGQSLSEGGNVVKSAGAALLGGLAGILNQLGQLAIGAGLAISGIKKALTSLNPVAAIAAGAALIGLAGFVKGQANRLAGNIGGGSGVSAGSGVGSGVSQNISGGGAQGFGFDRNIQLFGKVEVEGDKLVYAISNSNNYRN